MKRFYLPLFSILLFTKCQCFHKKDEIIKKIEIKVAENFVKNLNLKEIPDLMLEDIGLNQQSDLSQYKIDELHNMYMISSHPNIKSIKSLNELNKFSKLTLLFFRKDAKHAFVVIERQSNLKTFHIAGLVKAGEFNLSNISFDQILSEKLNQCGFYSLLPLQTAKVEGINKAFIDMTAPDGIYLNDEINIDNITYFRAKENKWISHESLQNAILSGGLSDAIFLSERDMVSKINQALNQ